MLGIFQDISEGIQNYQRTFLTFAQKRFNYGYFRFIMNEGTLKKFHDKLAILFISKNVICTVGTLTTSEWPAMFIFFIS